MKSTVVSALPEDFRQFLALSAEIGRDILKTQGAGGNTSIKHGDCLWVKASGTWLANALDGNIMVPVDRVGLLEALRAGDERAEKATAFIRNDLDPGALRPSIETTLHAALPQRVIAHFHCVHTIALAVLARREDLIANRMAHVPDLKWALVPYHRPGIPLAQTIDSIAETRPDVIILANHGLIVCGETIDEVRNRIQRVTTALAGTSRHMPAPALLSLEGICRDTAYRPARDAETHATALYSQNIQIATGGSLYPDHVIFLGTRIGLLADGQVVSDFTSIFERRGEQPPKLIIAPGIGVLLPQDMTTGGEAMARCLSEVVSRIPDGEPIIYLTKPDEYALTGWEAEKYRQSFDRGQNAQ